MPSFLERLKSFVPIASVFTCLLMWLINTEIKIAISPIKEDMNKISAGIEFLKSQGYSADDRLNELSYRLDQQSGPVRPTNTEKEIGKYARHV